MQNIGKRSIQQIKAIFIPNESIKSKDKATKIGDYSKNELCSSHGIWRQCGSFLQKWVIYATARGWVYLTEENISWEVLLNGTKF